mmetsp:Transcript_43793/g.115077  ORF Transcript_43793/g.115077 Transcript_43793/m.115077 type:complete len:342 (-) Transcript_43793:246-1271(-)
MTDLRDNAPPEHGCAMLHVARYTMHWAAVNGGVFAVAALITAIECTLRHVTGSRAASTLGSTCALYAVVFAACAINLRGRQRHDSGSSRATRARSTQPIAWRSIVAHPLGSALERYVHGCMATSHLVPSAVGAMANVTEVQAIVPKTLISEATLVAITSWSATSVLGAVAGGALWWVGLATRLLVFEVVFDAFFYVAHRLAHAVPAIYLHVHKLHHAHTHDVRLLSSLQMTASDVLLTHTLPVLAALALVPLDAGLELSIAKTYLLFQELYGHAGVEHRGRCFGPAPFVVSALGIDLCAEDHRRHHIQASVNFSKRFSLWDKLLGTFHGVDGAPRSKTKQT